MTDRIGDGRGQTFLFLDEVQLIDGFEDVVNGFHHIDGLDVYITGSNSRFLSTDIVTEFRGRGDEVRIWPFSYAEFVTAYDGPDSWLRYYTFGGMPELLARKDDEQKIAYLQSLVRNTYIKDIIDRNDVRDTEEMDALVDFLCSAIGSLVAPLKISNTLKSAQHRGISSATASRYLGFLEDAFLFEKSKRYDVKGKRYLDTTSKYHVTDVGLRNARLQSKQQEESHIVENIIYDGSRSRGHMVDVGVVKAREAQGDRQAYRQLEIDFVANKGAMKCYIQSAFKIQSEEERHQEERSLMAANDAFKKIVIVGEDIWAKRDEKGLLTIGIKQSLLDEHSLELWDGHRGSRVDELLPCAHHDLAPLVVQADTTARLLRENAPLGSRARSQTERSDGSRGWA